MTLIITDFVERDQAVTLQALGGIDGITDDLASSPLFPYVAEALLTAWRDLDATSRDPVSFVRRWLRETDDPHAAAFAELVRERSEQRGRPPSR